MKQWFCGLLAVGLLVGVTGQAMAQPSYSFTTLDVPGPFFFSPSASGINASGQIVGQYQDAAGNYHGFLLDQSSFTTLDVPGATYTRATGINASGQIVGWYVDAAGAHGFLFYQCSYTTLEGSPFQHGSTRANGINDLGQIVGWIYCCGDSTFGFLLDQGSYTTFYVPGWDTVATGINASGQIVGWYDTHGFLLDRGSYTTLDVPGPTERVSNLPCLGRILQ
jgi:probable HAF family extracellular repeat protein